MDVDLSAQEADGSVWCSRRHALITIAGGWLTIEDLKSANGTFVNRTRLSSEQKELQENDTIQIGGVQLQLRAGQG